MKKFTQQIQALENEVFKNMGKCLQITIDLVQYAEIELNEKYVSSDDIGSNRYNISILLEAFNPKREYDIYIIKKLDAILKEWHEYKPIESKT